LARKRGAVREEIYQQITMILAGSGSVPASEIVRTIARKHRKVTGDDAAYWQWLGEKQLGIEVRAAVNKYGKGEEATAQLSLAGFQRLQTHYAIERGNQPWFVALEDMTDDEILGKVSEYEMNIIGNTQHRDELMKYYLQRASAKIALERPPL